VKLELNDIGELDQFMQYCVHVGRQFLQSTLGHTAAAAAASKSQEPRDLFVEAMAKLPDTPPEDAEPLSRLIEQHSENVETQEPARRKRRTKAEMEAARAGETTTELVATGSMDAAADIAAATPVDNPFAIAATATQVILDAPAQSSSMLAGTAVMQAADKATAAPSGIESIEHLRACQSFIQTHGMTKYNESFRDGLSANIAAYTPEQRAQHVAILEQLAA